MEIAARPYILFSSLKPLPEKLPKTEKRPANILQGVASGWAGGLSKESQKPPADPGVYLKEIMTSAEGGGMKNSEPLQAD
jgi:hypothetical protein